MKRKQARVAQSPERRPPEQPAPAPPKNDRRLYFAAALALILLTLAAFSNSFSTGFALDNHMLIEHARIQAATSENIALILNHTYWWPAGESGLYRPLTTLSYLINYAILGNGNHPAGYHWINFFLHAGNVWLVFALVLRLARDLRAAILAAALWAVHPVLTESVTNIVGRADLLGGFAILSGFLLYLKSKETTGWRRGVSLAGLAVVTGVGVFSKESAVVLPAIIILYEAACGSQWRKMVPGLVATLAPVGLMLWRRAMVLSAALPAEYPFTDNPIAGASFWIGRLTAVKVLARYLWLAIWPWKLSSDYSYSEIPLARGSMEDWVCWIAVACTVVLMAILWNRNRLIFFLAGFAFLNLLPASNLLFPIGTIMAERLIYLPLAGLAAAVVIAMYRFRWFPVCVALIVAGFAVRSWIRNRDWTDDRTMALASVQSSPRSFKTHRLLAAVRLGNDVDGAVAEADRSVAILAPLPDALDSPGPWNLAAVCHRAKGDSLKGDDARAQYEEAVKLAQRSITIERASRLAYDQRHGITSDVPPNAADGYRTLASAYLHLGRNPDALTAAEAAKKIDPSNSGAYEEIADAEVAQGHGEEAAVALAEGMFSTGDKNLLGELLELYRGGVDSKACAVKEGPHGPTLNPSCEIVMRDLCRAIDRVHRQDLGRRFGCAGSDR